MSNLRSKFMVGILYPLPLMAQTAPVATVTTKAQTVTTTAPVVPPQTITITTAKNGGKVSFTIPGQTLKPLTATVPGQTSPASFVSMNFTCSVQVVNGMPDLTKPMGCTVTAK